MAGGDLGSDDTGGKPVAEPTGNPADADREGRQWQWVAVIAVPLALILIELSRRVGRGLLDQGLPMVLPWPPLLARWDPHTGWGTPLAVICVLVGLLLQRRAAVLPWRRLLFAGWLLSLAWMMSLTLIDGFPAGWDALRTPNEYLHDLPRIGDPLVFLRTFTDYIAFSPTVDGDTVWTTHVAAHPPLATLVFWVLDQVGLGGWFWAGVLCVLASSLVAVGLPITLRELDAPDAARRMVPFAALLPGAVWMAVSADGLFAGVAVGGLAMACRGARRHRVGSSLAGGLLLGAALYLNYGLVLFGLTVLVTVALTARRAGLRSVLLPWVVCVVGVLLVTGALFALGFNWFTGLAQLRIRYYQQTAADRPFSYFVWANLAAWLIAWTPLLAYAVVRAVGVLVADRKAAGSQNRVVALVALSGVSAALVADLSAMSKAETERIWLTFGAVAYAGLALLRGRGAALGLVLCAGWAIMVNSLLGIGW
ncbi:MAG: hypothetical protein L0H41_00180 [Microlunatus sp.]|nr:hypothetical protein [Microlunatus sp.]MDN5803489.1 hypothetical protein [Microlunatus sp.]